MKEKSKCKGSNTAGPAFLTGPEIELRLERGDDPVQILIDQYEIAIYYILRKWEVNKYSLLTPIRRNEAGCDPVCAQYAVCEDCPLDERACEMILDATSRPVDDIDRYIAIVIELKKIIGVKAQYGPRPQRVKGPNKRTKLIKRRRTNVNNGDD